MKKLISIIIPVYRNEGSINPTYINLKAVLEDVSDTYDYEIVFINDGSDDNSLNELFTIKKIDPNVRIIDFVRNFGQVSAIHAGFEEATGDLLINISADMQDPPTLISDMIKKWEDGYKVVACSRVDREDDFISRVTSKMFYHLIKVSVPKIPEGGFDYFLLDKTVYKKIFSLNQRNSFLQGDILWFGYETYFIEYKRLKRRVGISQWTIGKKIKYFIDGLINTSYLPIRFMSFIGLITSIMGLMYSITVFLIWLFKGTPFKGYAPIMMVLLITSGLIMVMLGVVGEYLWRTYDEVRKRPKFIIKDRYE